MPNSLIDHIKEKMNKQKTKENPSTKKDTTSPSQNIDETSQIPKSAKTSREIVKQTFAKGIFLDKEAIQNDIQRDIENTITPKQKALQNELKKALESRDKKPIGKKNLKKKTQQNNANPMKNTPSTEDDSIKIDTAERIETNKRKTRNVSKKQSLSTRFFLILALIKNTVSENVKNRPKKEKSIPSEQKTEIKSCPRTFRSAEKTSIKDVKIPSAKKAQIPDFKSFDPKREAAILALISIQNLPKIILLVGLMLTLALTGTKTLANIEANGQEFFGQKEVKKQLAENPKNKNKILKDYLNAQDTLFAENFVNKIDHMERYGYLKKLTGSKIVEDPLQDRYVYKGNNGYLYYISHFPEDMKPAAESITALSETMMRNQIPFTLVLAPNKNGIASENFPAGLIDYCAESTNNLVNTLEQNGVDTLNLSQSFYQGEQDENETFYATDTHWTNVGAFYGYKQILEHFQTKFMLIPKDTKQTTNIYNYKKQSYQDTYIGSMGKRAGQKYVDKKDDITFLIPKFETKLTHKKFNSHFSWQSEKIGNYKETFINENILNSKDPYIDKYTALMGHGTPYETIENKKITDGSSLVIIKDSFAMPVASFLALNYEKTYIFDNRDGNIKNNLVRAINQINPDHVIMLISPISIHHFPQIIRFNLPTTGAAETNQNQENTKN